MMADQGRINADRLLEKQQGSMLACLEKIEANVCSSTDRCQPLYKNFVWWWFCKADDLMSLIFYLYSRLSLPTSSSPAVGVYGFLFSQDLGGVAMHVWTLGIYGSSSCIRVLFCLANHYFLMSLSSPTIFNLMGISQRAWWLRREKKVQVGRLSTIPQGCCAQWEI